jgi:hypothetical protein
LGACGLPDGESITGATGVMSGAFSSFGAGALPTRRLSAVAARLQTEFSCSFCTSTGVSSHSRMRSTSGAVVAAVQIGCSWCWE